MATYEENVQWMQTLSPEKRSLIQNIANLGVMRSNARNTSSRLGQQRSEISFKQAGGEAAYQNLISQLKTDPQLYQEWKGRAQRTGGLGQGMTELSMLAAFAALPMSGLAAAQTAATIPGQAALNALVSAGVPASTISSIAATQGVAGLNSAAAGLGTAGAGTTGGLLSTGLPTTGAGTSAADLEAAMQIPTGTSSTVGGPALSTEQIAALNAGGTISGGQVLSSAGNVVGSPVSSSTQNGLFGTGITGTQAISTGLGLLGSYAGGQAATNAAQTAANAQIEAARIAADAAKFRPVGVTTRFGQSKFGYDAQGNLTSAGYQLSPEIKAQQDTLMGISNRALNQYSGAQDATAPIGQGAQTLFGLGQGYLATTPQEQAAKFMADQQALLAPSREREMAALQARLQAQGRGGLAIGGTSTGMMAANPELEAFYNAQRMQDLQLAAQATQGGQQYATFGAGLLGTGSDLQRSMYGTQQAAYAPYQTALGGATTLEQLGQNPMDIGTAIGAKTSTAAAQSGILQAQGMTNAAQTMQPANAYSPWGSLLTGAGQAASQYGQQPQQARQINMDLANQLYAGNQVTPSTGMRLNTWGV